MAEETKVVHEGYIDRAKIDDFFEEHFVPKLGGKRGEPVPRDHRECNSCPAEFAGYKFDRCIIAVHQDGSSEITCFYK
jgi:hypothetical protein